MKYLYLLILVLSFQIPQAQIIENTTTKSQQESFDYHTLKQKRNKTAAWIMVGSGLVMTVVGLTLNSADESAELLLLDLVDVPNSHEGDWLIVLGSTTTVASIPFFISAGKNKRKAALSFKREQNLIGNITFRKSNNLSVALTIDF